MSKGPFVIGLVVVVAAIAWFAFRSGITLPSPTTTATPTATATNEITPEPAEAVDFSLTVPEGFAISVFAKDLPGARVMVTDKLGNMWVSQTSEGTVSLLEIQNGKVIHQSVVFKNLKNPHGLALDPDDPFDLYIAEENKISVARIYSDSNLEKIIDLAGGGRHVTRTIGFGQDKRLYVSIGSSCDVCQEANEQRAKIFSLNKDGSDFKEVARGLRNSVFFRWHPTTGQLWATDMGRDGLGDDLPPDEVNIIQAGKNYGWPNCFGKNIHDTKFDKNTYIRNPCLEPFETESYINLQAHAAPLGLAFLTSTGWPAEYRDDLLVALHGSSQIDKLVGYKIVRYKLNSQGAVENQDDFITGWLDADGKTIHGRPVDILAQQNGILYISDDKAGVIYRVQYTKPSAAGPTQKPTAGGPCYVGGCSSQICSDQKGMVSTCEFKTEYACYRTAECEHQANSQCGWTMTTDLRTCLERSRLES